jgi:hypothetical protein
MRMGALLQRRQVGGEDLDWSLIGGHIAPRKGEPGAAEQIRGLVPVQASSDVLGQVQLGRVRRIVVVEAQHSVRLLFGAAHIGVKRRARSLDADRGPDPLPIDRRCSGTLQNLLQNGEERPKNPL